MIGNDPLEALPLVELDLSRVPEGVPRIAGAEVKWWRGSEIYGRTPPIYPKKLPRALTRRIQDVAVESYRVLGLRDYGRVDLRVTERGEFSYSRSIPIPGCLPIASSSWHGTKKAAATTISWGGWSGLPSSVRRRTVADASQLRLFESGQKALPAPSTLRRGTRMKLVDDASRDDLFVTGVDVLELHERRRSQYRGTLESMVSDQASIPPAMLLTLVKPCFRKKCTAFMLRAPLWQ